MKADTVYFGVLDFKEQDIIRFEEGLFGFENQKDFLPVPFDSGEDTLLCLQSITDKDISFILMNPFKLCPDYMPALRKEDYSRLGSSSEQELSYYVICVIRGIVEESTVNLKCPIVVNSISRKALQVVLDTDRYGFRHPLSEFSQEED